MQKICPHCGAMINDNDKFCTSCGTPVKNDDAQGGASAPNRSEHITVNQSGYQQNGYQQTSIPYYQPPQQTSDNLVSIGAYIGYTILFSLPLIGLIFAIVFAINHENQSLKNFARAHLILIIASGILSILLTIFVIAIVAMAESSSSNVVPTVAGYIISLL